MKKLQTKLFISGVFLLTTLFQSSAFAGIESVLGLPLNQNPALVLQAPETSEPEIILSRDQYVLSYNKNRRAPNWVAWKLETKSFGASGRTNNFAIDTDLSAYLAKSDSGQLPVDPAEYKGSCYDRGHQIPSADRTVSPTENNTTFLMSNMIPQTAYLNRVIWEHLEAYSRDLVQKQGKKLYIIAGPIYDQNFGDIGPQKNIPVPSKDFKIIYVLDANQDFKSIDAHTETIAVIMPNILPDGSTPVQNPQDLCKALNTKLDNKADWEQYKTTIPEIERISGINFTTAQNTQP